MCVSCGFTCTTVHLWRSDNLQVLALALPSCSRQSPLATAQTRPSLCCRVLEMVLSLPSASLLGHTGMQMCVPLSPAWLLGVISLV